MGSLRDPVVPLIHMGGPCSGTVLVGMSREQPQGAGRAVPVVVLGHVPAGLSALLLLGQTGHCLQ